MDIRVHSSRDKNYIKKPAEGMEMTPPTALSNSRTEVKAIPCLSSAHWIGLQQFHSRYQTQT